MYHAPVFESRQNTSNFCDNHCKSLRKENTKLSLKVRQLNDAPADETYHICGPIQFKILLLAPGSKAENYKWSWRFIRPAVELAEKEGRKSFFSNDRIQKYPKLIEYFERYPKIYNTIKRQELGYQAAPVLQFNNSASTENIGNELFEDHETSIWPILDEPDPVQDRQGNWHLQGKEIYNRKLDCNDRRTLLGVIGPVTTQAALLTSQIVREKYKTIHVTPGFISEHYHDKNPSEYSHMVRTGPTSYSMARAVMNLLEKYNWVNTVGLLFKKSDVRSFKQVYNYIGEAFIKVNQKKDKLSVGYDDAGRFTQTRIQNIKQINIGDCEEIREENPSIEYNRIGKKVKFSKAIKWNCVSSKITSQARILIKKIL